MKDKNNSVVITCPHCGCEYMPVEIFIPNSFFGKPLEIEKEATTGKIQYYLGNPMDLTEKYICDRCNQPFKIKTQLKFFTEGIDFNTEYKTQIKKQSLFLSEE